MNLYLSVIRECLETGISPRCHLEDITRSDIYGFVIPFCVELMKLKSSASASPRLTRRKAWLLSAKNAKQRLKVNNSIV